jgi:hypothetical protein
MKKLIVHETAGFGPKGEFLTGYNVEIIDVKDTPMKIAEKIQIINRGICHCSYFDGCGVCGTEYDTAVTGVGEDAKAAYEDAVDLLFYSDIEPARLDKLLPKRPRGITRRESVPLRDCEDVYAYVSIRVKYKE